jgi:hypothetical protein
MGLRGDGGIRLEVERSDKRMWPQRVVPMMLGADGVSSRWNGWVEGCSESDVGEEKERGIAMGGKSRSEIGSKI